MGTKKQYRQAKKNAKRKQKRQDALDARKRRAPAEPTPSGRPASVPVTQANGWPIHDCYLSSTWTERGARVHAVFARAHEDGRRAVAVCEVDLAREGVVDAEVHTDWLEGHIGNVLIERATEDAPLLVADPELVAKVIDVGAAWGRAQGFEQPAALGQVRQLFGDVSPEDCTFEIYTGEPDEPEAERQTFFGWLFSLVGVR